MITEAIQFLSKKQNLNQDMMKAVMEEIMTGKAGLEDMVSFLTRLSDKGETVEELTAAVAVMREHATKIETKHKLILDTCGTGGDRSGTFNISTIVAFVASAGSVAVAKHGNRSVSSRSGSADILEELGVDINMSKQKLESCLDEIGIVFLFAPNLHPAMKYAMPARKKIGKRTMFNILGPLSNPAGATNQLVGVYDRRWVEPLARVLLNLGSKHVLIVHGADGLDEITTTSKTFVSEAKLGAVQNYEINPEDFGIKRTNSEELLGSEPSDNAKILLDILKGKEGPKKDIVLLNSAAALYVADRVKSISEGLELAKEFIETGKAFKRLELLREFSQMKP